jgi:CheY-like chemotaxis protein
MGRTRGQTIIFVEDEPAVQRLVEYWLEDAGYIVRVAGDGAEGLQLIRSIRPDLVVTDALMPVMTGDELVEVMQQDPDLRAIPVMMATAAASPFRIRRMLALGCRSVIAKPMEEAAFIEAVREALPDEVALGQS